MGGRREHNDRYRRDCVLAGQRMHPRSDRDFPVQACEKRVMKAARGTLREVPRRLKKNRTMREGDIYAEI